MVIWAEFDAMGWARGVAALLSSHLRYVKVQRKFSVWDERSKLKQTLKSGTETES